jgi:hypothetical protein
MLFWCQLKVSLWSFKWQFWMTWHIVKVTVLKFQMIWHFVKVNPKIFRITLTLTFWNFKWHDIFKSLTFQNFEWHDILARFTFRNFEWHDIDIAKIYCHVIWRLTFAEVNLEPWALNKRVAEYVSRSYTVPYFVPHNSKFTSEHRCQTEIAELLLISSTRVLHVWVISVKRLSLRLVRPIKMCASTNKDLRLLSLYL